ncbi:MAG: protein kinase [Pseudomonadota bacterium]
MMSAEHDEMLITAETMVDHFKVVRLIGRGGMGEVYLARDIRLGRRVALKVIRRRLAGMQGMDDRFLREAQITASLNHPHIVTVYAVGEHRGNPYLALEYVEGQTLRQRMDEAHPALKESMRIGLAIAQALAEAHCNKVLHRDLKPENVLLAKDGRLRVLDLGLAKLLGEGEEIDTSPLARPLPVSTGARANDVALDETDPACWGTRSTPVGTMVGTPIYMAPEAWRNEPVSEAADVWALGVILHELVVGRRPYQDTPPGELSTCVSSATPVPDIDTPRGTPHQLGDLIAHCLAKSPAARPPAQQIVETLEELLRRKNLEGETPPFRGLAAFGERHADLFFGRDTEIGSFLEALREQPVLTVVGPSGAGKSSFVQAGVVPRLREQQSWVVVSVRPGSDPFGTLAARLAECRASPYGLGTDPSLGPSDFQRLAHSMGILAEPTPGIPHLSLPFAPAPLASIPARVPPAEAASSPLSTAESVSASSPVSPASSLSSSFSSPQQALPLPLRLRKSPRQLNVLLHELAEHTGAQVLLFVDQLEEVFTLVADDSVRRGFVESIYGAADDPAGPVRVVLTVRDDFLGRVVEGTDAWLALERVVVLRRPGHDALERMLTGPLEALGYHYDDPGLVAEMVASVKGEPACLPLVQFACQLLWERRDARQRLLLRSAYEAMGGIAGALAEHADGVLEGMPPDQARIARQLLVSLVTPEGTRRVLPVDQVLADLGPTGDIALARLAQARLLTLRKGHREDFARAIVELAHESLIRTWSRLARWLEESKEENAFVAELAQAAELWQKRGRRIEELWQERALGDAIARLERYHATIPPLAGEFIAAGIRREDKARRRRRALALTGSSVLVLAAVGSMLVTSETARQRDRAEQQQQIAEAQRRNAEIQRAEAQLQGARAAFARGDLLGARAQLRSSLEAQDSLASRALWHKLARDPLVWRQGLGDELMGVDFAPDGKTVAVVTNGPSVYLFSPTTAIRQVLSEETEGHTCLAYSPDGRWLATGTDSGKVTLWDTTDGLPRHLSSSGATLRSVEFSPDSRLLATASTDGTARLLDVVSGEEQAVLAGHDRWATKVTFSPDGETLATMDLKGTLRLWHLASRQEQRQLVALGSSAYAVDFSPDGSSIAVGHNTLGDYSRIRIFDVSSGRELRVFASHSEMIVDLRYHPDGRVLASASMDESVRLWDVTTGSELAVLLGHSEVVAGAAFNADGTVLASAGYDGTINLWHLAAARFPASRVVGHSDAAKTARFTPNGQQIVSAGADKTVRVWDARSGNEQRVLYGHAGIVNTLAVSPDGKRVASGSNDRTVRLWSLNTGGEELVLLGHRNWVTSVAFVPNKVAVLASGDGNGQIILWDLVEGRQRIAFSGCSPYVLAMDISPDGRLLAAIGKELWLWDTGTLERLQTIPIGPSISRSSFSPDSSHLAIGNEDGSVKVWDIRSATGTIVGRRGTTPVQQVVFSPDGSSLAAASSDGNIGVWRTAGKHSSSSDTAEPPARPDTPLFSIKASSPPTQLDFSPSGRHLLATFPDGAIRLWDATSGLPFWRAPVLLSSTHESLTQAGWLALDDNQSAQRNHPPSKWRSAIEQHGIYGADARTKRGTELLCLWGQGDSLELWSPTNDELLWSRNVPGLTQVVAIPDGCAVIARRQALVFPRDGGVVALRDDATALAWSVEDVLVAADAGVHAYDQSGTATTTWPASAGATAIRRIGDWLAVGNVGGVELIRTDSSGSSSGSSGSSGNRRFWLQETPPSAVTRLSEGPPGTLAVGFAGGTVGIWALENGALLDSVKLHGPVAHLLFAGTKLYAVTEVGASAVLDLAVFYQDYCDILSTVWKHVPIVWGKGLPVEQPPPQEHPCGLSSARR